MGLSTSGLAFGTVALATVVAALLHWLRRKKSVTMMNKVVMITGASSGLGEACAHMFYEAGAKLILCARRVKELERVRDELVSIKQDSTTYTPRVLELDLADFKSIPEKVNHVISIVGQIDVLINNGGVSYRGHVSETSLDVDISVMNVNYFGQVCLTKSVLPHMLKKNSGHIVAVGSVQSKIAIPYRSAYAASKHALQAFCDSLRAEVAATNIRVSLVCPSYIQTKLSLNAVTGQGLKYGVVDSVYTSDAMKAEYVAEEILKAVSSGRHEVILGPALHHLIIYIRTIFPGIFFKVMAARAAKQNEDMRKEK